MTKAASPAATGYSGTPLAKKLGFKASSRVVLLHAPDQYHQLVAPLPERVHFLQALEPEADMAHVFVTEREDVIRELALPLGFVDVKVCAVTEVWSGLKLVVRKAERTSS